MDAIVRVTVRAPVPTLGPLHLPAFHVGGQAVAEPEPSQ